MPIVHNHIPKLINIMFSLFPYPSNMKYSSDAPSRRRQKGSCWIWSSACTHLKFAVPECRAQSTVAQDTRGRGKAQWNQERAQGGAETGRSQGGPSRGRDRVSVLGLLIDLHKETHCAKCSWSWTFLMPASRGSEHSALSLAWVLEMQQNQFRLIIA